MKKFLSAILLTVCMLFMTTLTACDYSANIIISEDYETMAFNGQTYTRTNYFIEPPVDIQVYNPIIKGESIVYYLLPFFWDYVYVSDSEPDYLWLETELDTLNGKPFKKYGELVIYKLNN